MKKLILAVTIFATTAVTAQAQEVFKEVLRLAKETVNDEKKDLETRKVARFKVDALDYMAMKTMELMPDSSVSVVDFQAYALYEYVNLYVKRLAEAKNKKQKELVKYYFKQASASNSRFQDMDSKVTLAYYNSNDFITQFCLDCDWVKALAEIRARDWSGFGK